jgi:hypothetical protein
VERERAPSAARFHDGFAGPEPELPAHMFQLGLLRLLERGRRGGEVRAGIDHTGVQPEPVELVSDVVMMVNVLAGPAEADRAETAGQPSLEGISHRARLGRREVDRLQKGHQVALDVDGALRVALPKLKVGMSKQPQQCRACLDPHVRNRRCRACGECLTVPQHPTDRACPELLEKSADDPPVDGVDWLRQWLPDLRGLTNIGVSRNH